MRVVMQYTPQPEYDHEEDLRARGQRSPALQVVALRDIPGISSTMVWAYRKDGLS